MCEFCVSHGEGKKWYENMANYSRELFCRVNSDEQLKRFLAHFADSMRQGVALAERWQTRLPGVYARIIYPLLTRRQKKNHFGQILPLEDVEKILGRVDSIVRLPCVCRKVNTGKEKRFCYGVGMEAGHILREVPDYSSFERLGSEEAVRQIRTLDRAGMAHSVWTFRTPFIGAICNCDRDCMAHRIQYREKLAQVMWRAEYVAMIEPTRCNGCRECQKLCLFGAVRHHPGPERCSIEPLQCYGCGTCRAVCVTNAITLLPRREVATAASRW